MNEIPGKGRGQVALGGDLNVSNLFRGLDSWPFSPNRESDYAEYGWLAVERRTAELGAKAAATLWCVRRGVPAPNAAAAATEGPKGPRRQAERSRWRSRCYIPHLRESNPLSSTNHVERHLAGGFDE